VHCARRWERSRKRRPRRDPTETKCRPLGAAPRPRRARPPSTPPPTMASEELYEVPPLPPDPRAAPTRRPAGLPAPGRLRLAGRPRSAAGARRVPSPARPQFAGREMCARGAEPRCSGGPRAGGGCLSCWPGGSSADTSDLLILSPKWCWRGHWERSPLLARGGICGRCWSWWCFPYPFNKAFWRGFGGGPEPQGNCLDFAADQRDAKYRIENAKR
jgi:hypothetical protein